MSKGKGLSLFVLAGGFVFFLASLSLAAPNLINYQGVLNDSGGNPVNGPVDMEFRIFDADQNGNMEWGETHSQVQITNGKYSNPWFRD